MIQVHTDLSKLPVFKNAVVTIGTFDGVHLGHQLIIKQLKEEARNIDGETVIITFHPHPRTVLSNGKVQVKIINTLQEKVELLNDIGIDHLVVVPFTHDFAGQPAEEYVSHFLVEKFHPHTVIIGYDHHFGKDRTGDYHLLEDMGKQYNYQVKEISERILNEVIISSTQVRQAILHHEVEKANELLGYVYFFEGEVIDGNKMGKTIGYPTANLKPNDPDKLIPGNGVYAVEVNVGDDTAKLGGMMNIGVRPTLDGSHTVIEVNIFDFDKEIYGETIKVFVKKYLRSEIKFSGVEALKTQLSKDKEHALAILAG